MIDDFLKEHIPAIITGILGLGAWIFEKRKKNAEIKHIESDAVAAMQKTYNTFVEDMKLKYDDLKGDYVEMRAKVDLLEREVIEWKSKYETLKGEMNRMENGVQTTPNTNPRS